MYLPFGASLEGEDRYTFTGQESDHETNLMYYNARYYSPYLRQFTQPDEVVFDIYDPQQLNRYAYTRNNPVKYTDPSGNIAFLAALAPIAVGAAVGGAIGLASYAVSTAISGENFNLGTAFKYTAVGAVAGGVAVGATMVAAAGMAYATTVVAGKAAATAAASGITIGSGIVGQVTGNLAHTALENGIIEGEGYTISNEEAIGDLGLGVLSVGISNMLKYGGSKMLTTAGPQKFKIASISKTLNNYLIPGIGKFKFTRGGKYFSASISRNGVSHTLNLPAGMMDYTFNKGGNIFTTFIDQLLAQARSSDKRNGDSSEQGKRNGDSDQNTRCNGAHCGKNRYSPPD